MIKARDVEEETLTYHTLANDFREGVRLQTKAIRPEVETGSFGPSFAGQEDPARRTPVDVPQEGDEGLQAKSGKKEKKAKRKRPDDEYDDTTTSGRKACRACQFFHPLSRCYYAFPEMAPEGFRPRKECQEALKLALKEDPKLAEELKRIRKMKED